MTSAEAESLLKERGWRIDDLQRRGYRIFQDPKRFCFGVDAAFLAWFSRASEGQQVLDLCSGTGIVPILMDARYACGDYTGLEILPEKLQAELEKRGLVCLTPDVTELKEGGGYIRCVSLWLS